jgi:hypothetical protein
MPERPVRWRPRHCLNPGRHQLARRGRPQLDEVPCSHSCCCLLCSSCPAEVRDRTPAMNCAAKSAGAARTSTPRSLSDEPRPGDLRRSGAAPPSASPPGVPQCHPCACDGRAISPGHKQARRYGQTGRPEAGGWQRPHSSATTTTARHTVPQLMTRVRFPSPAPCCARAVVMSTPSPPGRSPSPAADCAARGRSTPSSFPRRSR